MPYLLIQNNAVVFCKFLVQQLAEYIAYPAETFACLYTLADRLGRIPAAAYRCVQIFSAIKYPEVLPG